MFRCQGHKFPNPPWRYFLRAVGCIPTCLDGYVCGAAARTAIQAVWWKMLRGLTTRNYPLVTRSFAQAYGIEKSATSERFIQASRDKLKELMERPLGELKLCAIVIDGTPFKGRQMMAAIGVGNDGKKTVLGLREGAT